VAEAVVAAVVPVEAVRDASPVLAPHSAGELLALTAHSLRHDSVR
jgi:hypothetical protein